VYSPVFGSPESTANCIPFLSRSSVHFISANDSIIGVPLGFAAAADFSALSSPSAVERLIAAINKKSLLM
jgi:hypothetical protein